MPFLPRVRARLYDALIVSMTADWYRAVLERLPWRTRLLDVGIGTGSALLAHAPLVRAKELRIVGVDIDGAYIEQCRRAVERAGLTDGIDARLESVYEHRAGPYDAIYFSGSFMLLPDPRRALASVSRMVAPGGLIYFTQTFESDRSPALEIVKPLLRWVTTIDFGRVTYEDEFGAVLADAGVRIIERQILQPGKRRSAVLIVAEVTTPRGVTDGECPT